MKIAIGADRGGYELKEEILKKMSDKYSFIDCGTFSKEIATDYPNFAHKVAYMVKNKEAKCGIVICRSGIGVSIVANKVSTIRCALVYNEKVAVLCKEHNNANVIALAADYISVDQAVEYIELWLNSTFMGGRHQSRVDMITDYENRK